MRPFQLGALSAIVIGALLAWSLAQRALPVDQLRVQAAFGGAAGILCAFAVLSSRVDLIPDQVEPSAAVAASLSLAGGLWLLKLRRS